MEFREEEEEGRWRGGGGGKTGVRCCLMRGGRNGGVCVERERGRERERERVCAWE